MVRYGNWTARVNPSEAFILLTVVYLLDCLTDKLNYSAWNTCKRRFKSRKPNVLLAEKST